MKITGVYPVSEEVAEEYRQLALQKRIWETEVELAQEKIQDFLLKNLPTGASNYPSNQISKGFYIEIQPHTCLEKNK